MTRSARAWRWLAAAILLGACATAAAACDGPADPHPASPAERAEAIASAAPEAAAPPAASHDAARGPSAEGSLARAFDLLRDGQWKDAAAAATDDGTPVGTTMWHYVRGASAAGAGEVPAATSEFAAFETATKAVPAGPGGPASDGTADILEVARLDLSARVAWAKGDVPAALLAWGRAAVVEDRRARGDAPAWRLPVRERLGAALLVLKNGAQAEGVFRAELERRPTNARALHGLAESLALQGRTGEAGKARAAFEANWTGTGDPLPLGPSARRP